MGWLGSECDTGGCDFNSYRMGNTTFYGHNQLDIINTNKPITVVTQFITADGTDTGNLIEIKRKYIQDGVEFENSASTIPGVTGNSITDAFL